VFRFANRIPLLFEPGSDVIVKQALDIDWGRYKIDKSTNKLGIFVSVVSTRIPFRGTGKEHIAEDVKELAEEARALVMRDASLFAMPCCGVC
jgi:DNA topoisomerase VI subunit B